MQRVTLICIGKMSEKFYSQGAAEYIKRLAPLCRFEIVELAEELIPDKNPGNAAINTALEKEARRILAAVPKGAKIISLCVEGKQLSSEEFARDLEQAAVNGNGSLAFVIGSSHGLAPEVKQISEIRLSLSKMTLPHQLARLFLLEQIYRAFMIRAGTKYHK